MSPLTRITAEHANLMRKTFVGMSNFMHQSLRKSNFSIIRSIQTRQISFNETIFFKTGLKMYPIHGIKLIIQ